MSDNKDSPPFSLPPQIDLSTVVDINDPKFIAKLYEVFKADFIYAPPNFQGEPLIVPWEQPKRDSKEESFWHLITHGPEHTICCPERCKRLPWPKHIIENCGHPFISIYEESRTVQRGTFNRTHIFLMFSEEEGYLVILEEQENEYSSGYALVSAYPVFRKHQIRKYYKKCPEHKKPRPLLYK